MIYTLSLDPDLEISPAEFAAAWNVIPECRENATAQVKPGIPTMFDPYAADLVSLVVVPLLVNLASNALYDLIKAALLKGGVQQRTRIEQRMQPDGSVLTTITVENET